MSGMSDVEKKRQALLAAYSGPKWANRVKNMSEAQVIAVYLRLKRDGKV